MIQDRLNEEIEDIAVETIAQSRMLLSLRGIDIQNADAVCLPVLIGDEMMRPIDKVD